MTAGADWYFGAIMLGHLGTLPFGTGSEEPCTLVSPKDSGLGATKQDSA